MKNVIKFTQTLLLLVLITTYGCSNDDTTTPLTEVEYTKILKPDATGGKDAIVYTNNMDANGGNNPDLIAYHLGSNTIRGYIQFDFSEIPENATVKSVKLSLFSYESPYNGDHDITNNLGVLQKVNSAWEEDIITWNTQPTSTEVNQVVLALVTSPIQDYLNIDVTNLMTGMIQDQSTNNGIMIKLENETINGKMLFASSDNANPDLHPMLEINYTVLE